MLSSAKLARRKEVVVDGGNLVEDQGVGWKNAHNRVLKKSLTYEFNKGLDPVDEGGGYWHKMDRTDIFRTTYFKTYKCPHIPWQYENWIVQLKGI